MVRVPAAANSPSRRIARAVVRTQNKIGVGLTHKFFQASKPSYLAISYPHWKKWVGSSKNGFSLKICIKISYAPYVLLYISLCDPNKVWGVAQQQASTKPNCTTRYSKWLVALEDRDQREQVEYSINHHVGISPAYMQYPQGFSAFQAKFCWTTVLSTVWIMSFYDVVWHLVLQAHPISLRLLLPSIIMVNLHGLLLKVKVQWTEHVGINH